MPVTIRPSQQAAEAWGKRDQLHSKYTHAASPESLLTATTSNDNEPTGYGEGGGISSGGGGGKKRIVQSSFGHLDRTSTTYATKNGLVHACIEAYNEHHNLVLRPEDVWLAILTQLSVYVNANADELRSLFVQHDGQKDLHIEVELEGLDHGAMAFQMTKLMRGNLNDPSLRDWILPAFSTTEKTDQAVASIIFMGTMQKYFTYSWGTRCGIPAVTLLGEMEDWIEISQRCAGRVGSGVFGTGPERWYRTVLKPVLAGFVETFLNPEGSAAQKFWKGVVDRHRPNGSGSVTYSGWITAFCYWDEKGRCLHETQSSPSRWGNILGGNEVKLSRGQIPMGFTKVPVTLWDDGKKIATEMVAGSIALRIRKPPEVEDAGGGGGGGGSGRTSPVSASETRSSSVSSRQRWEGFDTIQPETGWFMYRVQ